MYEIPTNYEPAFSDAKNSSPNYLDFYGLSLTWNTSSRIRHHHTDLEVGMFCKGLNAGGRYLDELPFRHSLHMCPKRHR